MNQIICALCKGEKQVRTFAGRGEQLTWALCPSCRGTGSATIASFVTRTVVDIPRMIAVEKELR